MKNDRTGIWPVGIVKGRSDNCALKNSKIFANANNSFRGVE